jgi:hypothetical protein
MNLVLIDHSFYKLTAQQAKQLSIENRLPRFGYEIKACPAKLAKLTFGTMRGTTFQRLEHCKAEDIRAAWVTRTPLSYWQGKPVKNNWSWALHVVWI